MASPLHVSSPSCLLPTCCVREPLALKSLLQNGHNQRLLVFCPCPCGCRARRHLLPIAPAAAAAAVGCEGPCPLPADAPAAAAAVPPSSNAPSCPRSSSEPCWPASESDRLLLHPLQSRGPVRDHLEAFGCLRFVVRQPVCQ